MAQIDNTVLDKLQTFIAMLKNSGISIESAYLFGSYATNHAGKWSDIDVAIVSPDFSEDRFADRIRLMKFSTEVDTRIEPVPFHSRDFIDADPLVGEIKKHGISLVT